MGPISNQLVGTAFVVIAAVNTVLMFYLWGFPFDKDRLRSEAPPRLLRAHRWIGYAFLIMYLVLMWQMVPRLWRYQIELPPRTVAHLLLGMAIGALLFVKIMVVRFFKHLEATLAPALGVMLFLSAFLLIGLALPFSLRETVLRRQALSGDLYSTERLNRVRRLLPIAGLQDGARVDALATPDGLMAGRDVLNSKCVQCHDLRTVLARPRTPDAWRQTVRRMAQRSTVLSPITDDDQWAVTAYLIAISPTLQQTVELQRALERESRETERAVATAATMVMTYDPDQARAVFEAKCSQCHDAFLVAQRPPATADAAAELVARMVSNGLIATEEELGQIIRYVSDTFAAR